MSQNNFSSENFVARKNFKKQIGEIKKIYEKNFYREKFIKWKKQKMYIQIKNSANIFLKKNCMQRTKKIKNKKNTRRSSLLPPGASARGEVPATAAAAPPREACRRASLGGSPQPPRCSPPPCRASLPRCSLRGGARRRAAPPCRQPAAQLAGRRLCLSGSRGKERGSRGKQRR